MHPQRAPTPTPEAYEDVLKVEPGNDDGNAARDEDAEDEQENTAKGCDDDYRANMLTMIPTAMPMQLT